MNALRRTATQAFVISCLAFLLLLIGAFPGFAQPPQNATAQALPSHPGDDLIVLTATVTDSKGGYISGLIKSDFTISDKTSQEIISFSSSDEPVSVGILLDASGSMGTPGGPNFGLIKNALSYFMQQSHKENDYFLIGFNILPQLLADWTRDSNAILEKITSLVPKENTAFYDACYVGLEKLTHSSHPKRVLLILSDGLDNESKYTLREVRKSLKESNVLLYAVGLYGGNDPGSSLGYEGQSILEELSAITGGKAFFPNSGGEMNEILKLIGYELRHQYQLGFNPAARDGKWHSIKIKVTLPPGAAPPSLKLYVRSREDYYAPSNPR